MDVRCEKCQTEYELDEARLKPGGVTVKCTNCGHMFKIRKRSNTNVGAPIPEPARQRPVSSKPPGSNILRDDVDPTVETGAAPERQWLIRLESGEQKSCRELATLQQWIVAGVVTKQSLISRSGKTWKSLGDIAELQAYFTIAAEAKQTREAKPTKPPIQPGTMLGLGKGPRAASSGGTIVDDDEVEGRTTGTFQARGTTQPPPPPTSTKTPPLGSATPAIKRPPPTPSAGIKVNAMAETQLQPIEPAPPPVRRPATQPPPPPKPTPKPDKPVSTWAAMPERPATPDNTTKPFSGKIAAIADEPAFASSKMSGRVRVEPADESSFQTGKVRLGDDDDDDVLPQRRGSRAGLWIALLVLLLGGGGAALYFLVLKSPAKAPIAAAGSGSADGGVPAPTDSSVAITPIAIDAAIEQPIDPLEASKRELAADVEPRLRDAMKALDDKDDPEAQALRAHVAAQLAGDLQDRAGLLTDKVEAEKLRKEAKTIVIDAATLAQKAHKAKPESGASNLAMAEVLRLQGKRPSDIKRYSDVAHADKGWTKDAAIADALVLARDGKLDDAKAAFAAIDTGDGKLEAGDVRARFHLALIAFAQSRPNDAKPMTDQVLAAQPEHAAARALAARLETLVAKSDPLPPEDHTQPAGSGSGSGSGSAVKPVDVPSGGGGSYDAIMIEANKIADSNCTRAIELYQKALDQKPDSVEAHTGMGYCFVDAKQFASAQSKFRTALRFSPRYEPALYGIAEAYHQQGRKDDAIEAYKAYLAVYPGTSKAVKALERLGVTDTGGATPPPTPPPTPPTTPTPTPEAGSGSG